MTQPKTAFLLVLFAPLVACKGQPPEASKEADMASHQVPAQARDQDSNQAALTRITDPSFVCMVNDQFMGRAQIPVDVEGRTYFGCCEMCKARLQNDASFRTATDPVSGKAVDKATAVIGKAADGRALYFESERTFAEYASRSGS